MDTPAENLVLKDLKDGVLTITLNQPEKRNPLSEAMLNELIKAFNFAKSNQETKVVVLTGAGDKAFCAGADLSSFDPNQSELERHLARSTFVELFLLMANLGKPIIGRINGHALAGGLGLAVSCDILVAAEHATFGTPEIKLGLWPMMIQAILVRNLPRKALMEMILLGERISAEQAKAIGLVNYVVPYEHLDAKVNEVASKLSKYSPLIMMLGRQSFYNTQDMTFEQALRYLQDQLSFVSMSEDAKEGIIAFFEKREPHFKGK